MEINLGNITIESETFDWIEVKLFKDNKDDLIWITINDEINKDIEELIVNKFLDENITFEKWNIQNKWQDNMYIENKPFIEYLKEILDFHIDNWLLKLNK
jgi:hypothetical protein